MKLGLKLGLDVYKSSGVVPGLLDDFGGAIAAYSLRYLTNTYTGDVVLVRRSSDDSEQGFTPSQITNGTLASFCGGGDGFVKTWYDQSGNTNHQTQSITTQQPKIVNTGSLITQGGQPAIEYDGADDGLMSSLSFSISDTIHAFSVLTTSDTSGIQYWGNVNNRWFFIVQSGSGLTAKDDSFGITNIYKNGVLQSLSTRNDWYNAFSDGNRHISSLLGQVDTNPWSNFGLFGYTSFSMGGKSQEIVIYNSDQSANRTAIETAINSYYSIY